MANKKPEGTGNGRGWRIAIGVLLIVVGATVGVIGGFLHYLTSIGFAQSNREDVTFLFVTLVGIGMFITGIANINPKKTAR